MGQCVRVRTTTANGAEYEAVAIHGKINGNKVSFQVTPGKTKSMYAAFRIARACYIRLADGESKEQVVAFRNDCIAKFCDAYVKAEPKIAAGTKSGISGQRI